MEIYFENSDAIYLTIYVNGAPADADGDVNLTVTRLLDSIVVVDNVTASRESVGKYYYVLDSDVNTVLGKYKAKWSYTVASKDMVKTEFYDVVVAYANAAEVRDYFSERANDSNDEIYRKEKLARRIINIFCNQTFDFEIDITKKVEGSNSDVLRLPRTLWDLTSVKADNTEDVTSQVEQTTPVYIERIPVLPVVDVKRDILNPRPFFLKRVKYYVKGNWGFQDVPENVTLAAILLINDYFNDDTLLRRHGVYQSTMGDVQYTFNNDLWFTTGNYDADVLLSPFTDSGIRLI